MVQSANITGENGEYLSCAIGSSCPNSTPHISPVWLNRFKPGGQGSWGIDSRFEGANVTFTGTNPTMVADLDGDGMADLVRVTQSADRDEHGFPIGTFTTTIASQLNRVTANGGWVSQSVTLANIPGNLDSPLVVQDVNRDGLADLVHEDFYYYQDGTTASSETVVLNQGLSTSGTVSWAPAVTRPAPSNGTKVDVNTIPPRRADIDGDGFLDLVDYVSLTGPQYVFKSAGFGDGTGYGVERGAGEGQYVSVLGAFTPPIQGSGLLDTHFAYALVDIDGDGLADLVRNHPLDTTTTPLPRWGGEILLNTGTTWLSVAGHQGWQTDVGDWSIPYPFQVPSESTAVDGSAFVDLDGDGMPDAVQEEVSASDAGAWRNPYRRPLIEHFPDGLAGPTTVTYVATTSALGAATYVDDETTEPSTKYLPIPLTVVSTVEAEDKSGTGGHDTTTYTYHSLRQDAYGRGPLGFRKVEMLNEASKVKTVTTYAQAYPYTGSPVQVDKFQRVDTGSTQVFHQVSQTKNTYCDAMGTPPPPFGCGNVSGQSFPAGLAGRTFVYPSRIEDVAFLHPEADDTVHKTTTVSTFSFDANGNSTSTNTTTTKVERDPVTGIDQTEQLSKTVTNDYVGSEQSAEGKPTTVTTTATGGTKDVTHTTMFEYAPVNTFGGVSATRLALTKTQLERDAGYPERLDTAYRYDQFGNVITTTSCASDFAECEAGAVNSNSSGDPAHPPFRTSTVSYDPAAAGLTVRYGVGRFPVRTTNPAGHTETTVYDPVLGAVLTKTGPNGIETCYEYDPLGRQTAQIERCNSPTPLVTTTQRFYVPQSICVDGCTGAGFFVSSSKLTSIIIPPTGSPTWSYTDDQGNTVASLTYTFEGGFVETTTAYNALGQVITAAKPFHLSNLSDGGSPAYTNTQYDDYHRVWIVNDDLGMIDDSGDPKTTSSTTTYNGSTTRTDRVVHAQIGGITTSQTETRFETKNVLGKPAAVTTAMPGNTTATTSYSYDADGNPTVIQDPSGSQILMAYDPRGRKTSMSDPDMGSWSYVVDGFGDLVSQTDARGQTTSMTYDVLSRLVTKTDGTGTAEWLYDVAPGAGKGKLAAMVGVPAADLGSCAIPKEFDVPGENRAVKTYQYTAFGDVQGVAECADGTTFVTSYQYDAVGRQSQIRYPLVGTSQLAVGYHYSTLGYLQYLTDDSSDRSVLWQAKTMNALGQVTDEEMRNGVETVSTRNDVTGWLLNSTSTAHADQEKVIQHWTYTFDEVGNLLSRGRSDTGHPTPSTETFTYDVVNRLWTATTTSSAGSQLDSYNYDATGNLTLKAGSDYHYNSGCNAGGRAAGPHAVCSVGNGAPFTYDGNGNLTNDGVRQIAYNPSNRVVEVDGEQATPNTSLATVKFAYGADGNRVVQAVTSGSNYSRTVYVGLGGTGKSMYERTTTSDGTVETVQHVHFIYAGGAHGGSAFAIRVLDSGGGSASRYYNFDHLGSVTAMSDEQGHVAAAETSSLDPVALGFDAWGARRNSDFSAAAQMSFDLPAGHREFTGHEQIPNVGLVNMNGRVYDPALGRFLSPDPNVQFVGDAQSYNRYSYVLNNPLRYSDPTGYWAWNDVGRWFANTFGNPLTDFELISSIVVCAGSAGAECITLGLVFAAMNVQLAIQNGAGFDQTIENSLIGMGVGVATGGIGSAVGLGGLNGLVTGTVSAAVTTGISNVMSGRSFFGYDMLGAAFLTAAQGAATLGLKALGEVSQASISKAYDANPQGNQPRTSGEALNEVLGQRQADEAGKALGNVTSANRVSARNEDGTGATSGNADAPPVTPRNYPKNPVPMTDLEGGAVGVTAGITGSIAGGGQLQVAFVCGGTTSDCAFVLTGQLRTQAGLNLGPSVGGLVSPDLTSLDQLGGQSVEYGVDAGPLGSVSRATGYPSGPAVYSYSWGPGVSYGPYAAGNYSVVIPTTIPIPSF